MVNKMWRRSWLPAVLLLLLGALSAADAVTIINGDTFVWTLSNDSTSVLGHVPGGVYSDLMNAGVLTAGDFYYRYNDLEYRWVSYCNWTYSTSFQVTPELANEKKVVIEFAGVDTVSTVVANGEVVGTTDNMFVKYYFDITNVVKNSSEVLLDVEFQSPVEWSRKAYETQAQDYVVPPVCIVPEFKGECHANHIRKMQSSFAWDWGPAFPSMGIWKPVKVIGFSTAYLSDYAVTDMRPLGSLPSVPDPSFQVKWETDVQVDLLLAELGTVIPKGRLVFYIDEYWVLTLTSDIGSNTSGVYTLTQTISSLKTHGLWWPSSHGSQELHELRVVFETRDFLESSEKTTKIGFKTTRLDQEFVDALNPDLGRNYRVYINNVLVFMRGSNWIPAHVLPELVTPEYTRRLLEDAVKTNQNAVRIWGGGIYEQDAFYEIADELGIVVWQDLMFACSMYPVNSAYLDSVYNEINTQLRRLTTHPSVLLFITNNENEGALRDNWYGTASDFDRYKADYITLYVDNIRAQIWRQNKYHDVVVSSPSNGIESENEGFISESPGSARYGDVHYYNYVSNAWNYTTYPTPRFASEYGFQSWPSFRTLSKVTSSEDWVIGSDMLEHRQHHPNGQVELDLQISKHMNLPDISSGQQGFEHYLYLTQVHQAMAIRTESEHYRRSFFSLDDDGYGNTAGALYWQLNDIWQGASWASIEFGGRWKMLHYYVKKFFSPIIISPYLAGDTVNVAVLNDVSGNSSIEFNLTLKLRSYLDFQPKITISTTSLELMDYLLYTSSLTNDLLLHQLCAYEDYDPSDVCFITFSATDIDGNNIAPDTFMLLGEPKNAPLLPAAVQVADVTGPATDGVTYTVALSTDAVALFVFLETDVEGVFSDNGFVLYEAALEVTFEARAETSAEELLTTIQVTTLVDTYNKA